MWKWVPFKKNEYIANEFMHVHVLFLTGVISFCTPIPCIGRPYPYNLIWNIELEKCWFIVHHEKARFVDYITGLRRRIISHSLAFPKQPVSNQWLSSAKPISICRRHGVVAFRVRRSSKIPRHPSGISHTSWRQSFHLSNANDPSHRHHIGSMTCQIIGAWTLCSNVCSG